MARPLKTGVEYFPLDVKLEDEVELIESEHSIVAFAVLLKLYQKIYASNYWVKWDKKDIIVFSKRINVDINSVNDIINSCLEWGLFDKNLHKKYGILTSNGIQKRFFEIVKRRKEIPVIEEYLLTEIDDNVDINLINVSKSTQSKVNGKKTKINNPLTNKDDFIKNIPDSVYKKGHSKEQVLNTIDNLIDYCKANRPKGYSDYYAALRNFLKKVAPENKSNSEKLSLDKFKEAIQYKKDNHKPGEPFKFKNQELNKIINKHPMIDDYSFDSKKFKLAFEEYLKL